MAGRDEEFKRMIENAKLLGGDEPPQPQVPVTSTQKILRSTAPELNVITDDSNTVSHYQLVLKDFSEHVTYVYNFDSTVFEFFKAAFLAMSDVGDEFTGEESDAEPA